MRKQIKDTLQKLAVLLAILLSFTATAQVAPASDTNAPSTVPITTIPPAIWGSLPRVPYTPPSINAAVRLNNALGITNLTAIPISAILNTSTLTIQNAAPDSPSPPNGALVITQQTKGSSAVATFSFLSEDGCVWTDVVIQGGVDSIFDPLSKRTLTQPASVSVSMYDMCLGVLTHFIWGDQLNGAHFEMDPNLGWAKLVAVLPVCDNVTGSCFDIYVECEWTISSSPTHELTNIEQHVPGYLLAIHANGKVAGATAKATVYYIINGEVNADWNLTPNPSDWGQMDDDTDRYHYVQPQSANGQ